MSCRKSQWTISVQLAISIGDWLVISLHILFDADSSFASVYPFGCLQGLACPPSICGVSGLSSVATSVDVLLGLDWSPEALFPLPRARAWASQPLCCRLATSSVLCKARSSSAGDTKRRSLAQDGSSELGPWRKSRAPCRRRNSVGKSARASESQVCSASSRNRTWIFLC